MRGAADGQACCAGAKGLRVHLAPTKARGFLFRNSDIVQGRAPPAGPTFGMRQLREEKSLAPARAGASFAGCGNRGRHTLEPPLTTAVYRRARDSGTGNFNRVSPWYPLRSAGASLFMPPR
jgi:hypothetical protein